MYDATDINIDPAAELGDGITASGVYSVISRVDGDGSGFPSVSAPGEAELEDEYPSGGPMTQEFNRKIAETRSTITKTAEEIRLEVENEMQGLSASFSVQLGSITSRVQGVEGNVSTLQQTAYSLQSQMYFLRLKLLQTKGKSRNHCGSGIFKIDIRESYKCQLQLPIKINLSAFRFPPANQRSVCGRRAKKSPS